MAQLIVYFSRTGENYVNGAIKNLTVGNTEVEKGLAIHGANVSRAKKSLENWINQ